jgi:hypothetical protein
VGIRKPKKKAIMKIRYHQKKSMAEAIADKLNIGLLDAQSRLSREPKPVSETIQVVIDKEKHDINFFLTPEKYL